MNDVTVECGYPLSLQHMESASEGLRGRWYDALVVEVVKVVELVGLKELYRELWVDSDEQLELRNSALAGIIC
jgi:hypothetical protein